MAATSQFAELADKRGGEPVIRLQPRLSLFFQGDQPLLLKTSSEVPGELRVLEVGEGLPAPQPQRIRQQPRPRAGVAADSRLRGQVSEPGQVHHGRTDPQQISGRLRHHQIPPSRLGVPQRSPELPDPRLQGLPRVERKLLAPQIVDEPIGRHRSSLMDQQGRQQSTDLRLPDIDRSPVRRPHGQRTEHSETHDTTVTGGPATGSPHTDLDRT